MSYYEGAGSADVTLATQNPYDGGITAHPTGESENAESGESMIDSDANSIFDDSGDDLGELTQAAAGFGSSFQEATGGLGSSFQEAAAGVGEITQALAGPITQAAAGIPARVYSGTGNITQAAAGIPARMYSGYDNAGPSKAYSGITQAAAGIPARMYSGTGSITQAAAGIPARMYSGYDNAGPSKAYSGITQAAAGIPARVYSGTGATPLAMSRGRAIAPKTSQSFAGDEKPGEKSNATMWVTVGIAAVAGAAAWFYFSKNQKSPTVRKNKSRKR